MSDTSISTVVNTYYTKENPKSVKLEIGSRYTMIDSYGTKEVIIEGIRKLGEEIIIYYKWGKEDGSWKLSWNHASCGLDAFKMQMLDYGKLNSLDILYPQGA